MLMQLKEQVVDLKKSMNMYLSVKNPINYNNPFIHQNGAV